MFKLKTNNIKKKLHWNYILSNIIENLPNLYAKTILDKKYARLQEEDNLLFMQQNKKPSAQPCHDPPSSERLQGASRSFYIHNLGEKLAE